MGQNRRRAAAAAEARRPHHRPSTQPLAPFGSSQRPSAADEGARRSPLPQSHHFACAMRKGRTKDCIQKKGLREEPYRQWRPRVPQQLRPTRRSAPCGGALVSGRGRRWRWKPLRTRRDAGVIRKWYCRQQLRHCFHVCCLNEGPLRKKQSSFFSLSFGFGVFYVGLPSPSLR